jgi:hypothetical protein
MAPSAVLIRVNGYYTKIYLAPKKLLAMTIAFATIISKSMQLI